MIEYKLFDIILHTMSKYFTKTHFSKDQTNVWPRDPIISLVHIKLNDNIATLIRLMF